MRSVALGLGLLVLGTTVVSADMIEVMRKQHHGEFEKFENGKFTFDVTFEETLELKASSVTALTLDSPRPVSLLMAGKQEPMDAKLLRFYRAMFEFEIDGVKKSIYPMKVKQITVKEMEPPPSSGASTENPGPRQFVDISGIEHRTDLPSNQMAALKQYISARDAYKAFLAESTRLVRMMDEVAGEERQELLLKLRSRKNAEQPVLRALDEAEEALFAAFPPPK